MLSDRAPPELHEPDNFGTFVSSPLKELLVPYPAEQMCMWKISPRVNSPKNDDPSLWVPVQAEAAKTTTDTLELLRE